MLRTSKTMTCRCCTAYLRGSGRLCVVGTWLGRSGADAGTNYLGGACLTRLGVDHDLRAAEEVSDALRHISLDCYIGHTTGHSEKLHSMPYLVWLEEFQEKLCCHSLVHARRGLQSKEATTVWARLCREESHEPAVRGCQDSPTRVLVRTQGSMHGVERCCLNGAAKGKLPGEWVRHALTAYADMTLVNPAKHAPEKSPACRLTSTLCAE